MSIGIAIAVPDGIALAADTQTTWSQLVLKVKEKHSGKEIELAEPIQVPVGWSQRSRKLFAVTIGERMFAITTAGESHLNSKSMYAVFQSVAHKYHGSLTWTDVSRHFISHLQNELASECGCAVEALHKAQVRLSEFILAGYEDGDVAKPVVESHLVFSGTIPINGKPDESGHFVRWSNVSQASRYGGCWIGQAAFISHIVNHSNPELPAISGQYAMMTLADAVDYTRFLVGFTCDFQRFAIMVPSCGRPVASATLTPDGYDEQMVP